MKNKFIEVPLNKIRPGDYQPRLDFSKEALGDLRESIRKRGLIQPIILSPEGDGYRIVAGERRFMAVKSLGQPTIAAIVREDLSKEESAKLALIENIQRADLDPIEEALAYRRILEEFDLTQEELGRDLGKSRSYIANSLRILKLPREVLDALRDGKISLGHSRTLVGLRLDLQLELLARTLKEKLSVRQLEALVANLRAGSKKSESEDFYLRDLESSLMEALGTKVKIKLRGQAGKIEIDCYDLDDLNRIIEKLL